MFRLPPILKWVEDVAVEIREITVVSGHDGEVVLMGGGGDHGIFKQRGWAVVHQTCPRVRCRGVHWWLTLLSISTAFSGMHRISHPAS